MDTQTATPTSGTLTINANGDNAISVTATDATGNTSAAVTQTLLIDTTPAAIVANDDVGSVTGNLNDSTEVRSHFLPSFDISDHVASIFGK